MNSVRNKRNQIAVRSANRERILDAAEMEFSKHGYEACTLRMIGDTSGVNLGLIHYYFGTKEALFSAAFLRRATLLAKHRLSLLGEARHFYAPEPIPLEELVRCFIIPTVEMVKQGEGPRAFVDMFARFRAERLDFGEKLRGIAFNAANREFIQEFQRACPHLDPTTVVWRLSAMVGAYYSVISQSGRVDELSDGRCNAKNIDIAIAQAIPFVVAGFAAPRGKEVKKRSRSQAVRLKK